VLSAAQGSHSIEAPILMAVLAYRLMGDS